MKFYQLVPLILSGLAAEELPASAAVVVASPVDIGSRLELFVDRYVIAEMNGVELRLGRPQPQEVVLRFDLPWEIPFAGALTVLKDGDVYRLYYRGANTDNRGEYDEKSEVTCYAESRDGIHWVKPILGLHDYQGSKANNLVMPPNNPLRISHNFAPFIDNRPGVPPEERFKAVGGTAPRGLFRLVSPDGINWKLFAPEPIFLGYALDTLNVALWSPAEELYVAYIRPGRTKYRSVSRSVSKDFVHWSEPVLMSVGDTPAEHIYTNGTHPYFRAPHILIALPFRFEEQRKVLSEAEHRTLRTHYTQRTGISDAVLMTSRGGASYDRTFMESFIRPGLERGAWTARSTLPALGVVPTGSDEMSIYVTTHHTVTDYHIRRYSLRTDGFASVHAPFAGGTMLTRPLVFSGRQLVANYSTSSVGSVRVEILDANGRVIPGYSLDECEELIGDEISRKVAWKGKTDLAELAGQPLRLRFAMKDADIYSLQFKP